MPSSRPNKTTEVDNSPPPVDTWTESDRNLGSPAYDFEAKNKGLRLKLASDGYLTLVNAILRPPRFTYDVWELGGRRIQAGPAGTLLRADTTLVHPTRGRLQVSEWRLESKLAADSKWAEQAEQSGGGGGGSASNPAGEPLEPPPCVVYIHGNAGSRCDVLGNGVLAHAAAKGLGVVALDCAGSGRSDGEWVTLGHYEQASWEWTPGGHAPLRALFGSFVVYLPGRYL
mmetsp:Transcript_4719/g.11084  ORF Transcript_4719/g.11084 Transcript_4719/m.11084 type:complete len:228 (-) Transcript_4719:202-885(-)